MGNSVIVGREATHGELADSLVAVPSNFLPRERQGNIIPDETRGVQDEHFTLVRGTNHLEWEVRDSYVYHDSIGLFLASALGDAESSTVDGTSDSVFDNVFVFEDDPASLSLEYNDPRRPVDPQRALYGVVDRLTIKFEADGSLQYAVNGVALKPETINDPDYEFTQSQPFNAWSGEVNLGGAPFADLVSGQIVISRNRSPFFTIRNSQSPKRMTTGRRRVEIELVMDFDNKNKLDDFREARLVDGLSILFSDEITELHGGPPSPVHPEFELDMGKLAYEDAEKDWDADEPRLKLNGKALYDVDEGRTIQSRLRSTVDYAPPAPPP